MKVFAHNALKKCVFSSNTHLQADFSNESLFFDFFESIKKMSKKPLKYNPDEVTVIKVDMAQDMFNFAMDTARECIGKFKKEDEPGMSKHAVDMFNAEHGEHWMSVVGDNYGVAVSHQGNFAHFKMGAKEFVIYKAA